jgi:hypothetical protein
MSQEELRRVEVLARVRSNQLLNQPEKAVDDLNRALEMLNAVPNAR